MPMLIILNDSFIIPLFTELQNAYALDCYGIICPVPGVNEKPKYCCNETCLLDFGAIMLKKLQLHLPPITFKYPTVL